MKRQSAHLFVAAVLALLGPLAQKGRGDFILWNDEQFTVNSYHSQGLLYDTSRVFIVPPDGCVSNLYAWNSSTVSISGGWVTDLDAHDSSTVDISGGSVTHLTFLIAHDSSVANISDGSIEDLDAWNSSTVNISGGFITKLDVWNSSTTNISGGNFVAGYGGNFITHDSSIVSISGGSSSYLDVRNSSTMNISGGSITKLWARDSSVVTFYGQNFHISDGLSFDGERVLGIGILSGEWIDGTRWATNITYNETTATILAIPESAHKPFCVKYPRMDFNGDCKVDFADFAIMASSWLECNLVPQSACWE